jgi:hypothetical protein
MWVIHRVHNYTSNLLDEFLCATSCTGFTFIDFLVVEISNLANRRTTLNFYFSQLSPEGSLKSADLYLLWP